MEVYRTHGTCSRAIFFEVDETHIITSCEYDGGCHGNTQGVARLVIGHKAEDIISMLKGIQCREGTSCPDQLAHALELYLAKLEKEKKQA